jgi:hypothetical protein
MFAQYSATDVNKINVRYFTFVIDMMELSTCYNIAVIVTDKLNETLNGLLRLASGIYAKMTLILLFSVHFW